VTGKGSVMGHYVKHSVDEEHVKEGGIKKIWHIKADEHASSLKRMPISTCFWTPATEEELSPEGFETYDLPPYNFELLE